MVKPAWIENPAIAVYLTQRYPSPKLAHDVRWLLLNFPAKALGIPHALELLLQDSLPNDISFQLKVCVFPMRQRQWLTFPVSALLGCSQSNGRSDLFPPSVR